MQVCRKQFWIGGGQRPKGAHDFFFLWGLISAVSSFFGIGGGGGKGKGTKCIDKKIKFLIRTSVVSTSEPKFSHLCVKTQDSFQKFFGKAHIFVDTTCLSVRNTHDMAF